ncbi:uncharacterized protein LOC111829689 [Capsella rubella]|uniref:uncharacterized protein LOC111829689 n=1 Tax=Capsella rubella TaxID=81985 RepID=UPI000CD4D670|nr:uncharacterized protein LOC111829689 [Capsella rubella]
MGISWASSLASAWTGRRRRRHRVDQLNSIEEALTLQLQNKSNKPDVFLWRGANDKFKSQFSTKDTWNHTRTASPQVAWEKGVWFPHATPKYSFCVWLAVHDRLPTGDRMLKWNIGFSGTCEFCRRCVESRDHLFFSCNYVSGIWASLTKGLLSTNYTTDWSTLITFISTQHKDLVHTFLLRYVFQTVVYEIWRERNGRRHGESPKPAAHLTKWIDQQVRDKLLIIRRAGDQRYNSGFQRWLHFLC